MKLATALFAIILNVSFLAGQEPPIPIDPAKRAEVRRLLEITGGVKLGIQFSSSLQALLSANLEKTLPEGERKRTISQRLTDRVIEKSYARFTAEAVDIMLPVYDKYFTLQELRDLNTFYESTLGRKVIQVMPQLLQESMAIGQRWAEQIRPQLFIESILEMIEEFPELKQLLEDSPSEDI